MKQVETYAVKVYIAGSIEKAKDFCQEYFYTKGWCCTIDSTTYVYTGGKEEGYVIGFINYGRFPSEPSKILEDVLVFADKIMKSTYQKSCSVVATDKTFYLENEELGDK